MALFGFGKKKEDRKGACCCASTPDAVARAQAEKRQGGIKVLGSGCAKCHEMEENTKAALAALGLAEDVQLITDFSVIATYGVMSTPALVVDEKVVSYGKVLKQEEVASILRRERGL